MLKRLNAGCIYVNSIFCNTLVLAFSRYLFT